MENVLEIHDNIEKINQLSANLIQESYIAHGCSSVWMLGIEDGAE